MSALIDSHKRLQTEYNNRPIRDADYKIVYCISRVENERFHTSLQN
jgi:hypothetical protein